jgi:glycosyltransferase involved in cell wall biosynthesis
MRIAFADFSGWGYNVQTVDAVPMGGSESATCYVARALAWLGHDVLFLGGLSTPGKYDGVTCLPWRICTPAQLAGFKLNALICVLKAEKGFSLREALGPSTTIILWNQHAANQSGVQPLFEPRQRDAFTAHALVSQWQRDDFIRVFGIEPGRSMVMRNAIAPVFCNLFPASSPILPQKAWPPILAYTSTPFRGLDVLLDAFPHIRAAVPGTRLHVFSSLKVYRYTSAEDEAQYGKLYDRCKQTEGVEYFGSVPQPELAGALRNVMVLAYPNTFAETSCIAVMEAMASGCRIVTSAFGALPETTAGFARLISVAEPELYMRRFISHVVDVLRECERGEPASEQLLRRQVDFMNSKATWRVRAGEWVRWLETLNRG